MKIPPCIGHEIENMRQLDKEEKRQYSRLKSLFFRLYELKSEIAVFEEGDELLDINQANYINTQKSEISELEDQIKQIIIGGQ